MGRSFKSFFITICFLSLVGASHAGFTLPDSVQIKDNAKFSTIERIVAMYLAKAHVRHLSLDDDISQKTYVLFLNSLDPQKLYFEARDIVEFEPFKNRLDENVRSGNLDFADLVITKYKQRVQERFAQVEKLMAAPEDFTTDETVSTDYEKLAYAGSTEESEQRLRQEIKKRLLSLKLADSKSTEADRKAKVLASFRKGAKKLNKWKPQDGLEVFLLALTQAFDPHSSYLSPASTDRLLTQLSASLTGIGASLQEVEAGGAEIKDLVDGGPAKLDGTLKIGDKIVGVSTDGTPEGVKDITELTLDEIVKLIRGTANTKVRLKVIPASGKEAHELVLTRAEIKLADSRAAYEVKDIKSLSGKMHKVGQIYLPAFYQDDKNCPKNPTTCISASNDLRDILIGNDFKDVELLMLDLRNDGGGSLGTAIEIVQMLSGPGPVVQTKTGNEIKVLTADEDAKPLFSGPIVVVINQASASASEIVSAALQDRERALIIGSRSFGKGTVQHIMPLKLSRFDDDSKGAIKLTVSEFFRDNGDSTQDGGVDPDVKLPSLVSVLYPREMDLPNALPHSKIAATPYEKFGQVRPEWKSELQKNSDLRREKDPHFDSLKKALLEAKKQKDSKMLSLNEKIRREQRNAVSGEDEDEESSLVAEDAFPLVPLPSDKKKEKSNANHFYNAEIQNIALEYLELEKK